MSDLLLQEIDEELRQDRIKAFWKRYGLQVGLAALLFMLLIASWRGYTAWKQAQAAKDGDLLINALKMGETAPSAESQQQLGKIIASGTKGAATLARFRYAGDEARLGNKNKAIQDFDIIAADGTLDAPLRNIASVRAAWLSLEQNDSEGVTRRMQPLATETGDFRHTARELLGLAAFKKKDFAAAAQWFDALLADPACPQGISSRGEMMAAVLEADGMSAGRARALNAPQKK